MRWRDCVAWMGEKSVVPWIQIAAVGAASIAAFVAQRSFWLNDRTLFYVATVATAVAVVVFINSSRLGRIAFISTIGSVLLCFALLLPVADFIYVKSRKTLDAPGAPKPVFSYRDNLGDPDGFRTWWTYYVNEWVRNGGTTKFEIPDPQGVLPHILVPNARVKFFDFEYTVNSLGFFDREFNRSKNGGYRIFVVGESPTWGPLFRHGDMNWPEMLRHEIARRLTCERPIELINGGVEAYTLQNSIDRITRDILPLEPDLIISAHGYNGVMRLLDSQPRAGIIVPQQQVRASPLLAALEFRYQLRQFAQSQRRQAEAIPSVEQALRGTYAGLYRRLIRLGNEKHFKVILATSPMAVTQSSPSEVIDFYSRTFPNIRYEAAATTVHNEMLKLIAAETGARLIDTTPQLAGEWDADLFVDPVHFTQKGAKLFSAHMYEGLKPILQADLSLRCAEAQ